VANLSRQIPARLTDAPRNESGETPEKKNPALSRRAEETRKLATERLKLW
jgi:hypothetical protein